MNYSNICGNPLLRFSLFLIISCHIYWCLYVFFCSINTDFVIEAILLIYFEVLLCDWVTMAVSLKLTKDEMLCTCFGTYT